MTLEIGLVCGNCDGYSAIGTSACVMCGMPLSASVAGNVAIPSGPPTAPDLAPDYANDPSPGAAVVRNMPDQAGATARGYASMPSSPPSSGPTIARPNLAPRAPADTVIDSAAPLFSEAMRPRRMTPPSGPAQQAAPVASVASVASVAQGSQGPALRPSMGSRSEFGPNEVGTATGGRVPPPADSRPSRSGPGAIPRPEAAAAGASVRPATSIRAPQPSQPFVSPTSGSSSGPGAGRALSLEELMEQAKNFVCRSCSTPVPVGHKFCGRCGAAVPPDILAARTQFFGQLQAPGKAKLILIRGEGVEGLSYQLNAEQHIVGRNGQLVFPDDPFVSPKHANLFYRNQKLVVRDEGSLNGVFLRVRGGLEIQAGDQFLAGEQLFRVDATPKFNDGPAPDGTYFYSSPKHQTPFRVSQVLQGGANGMVVCARSHGIQIGREGGDMNFPGDLYMSASHCKVDEAGGKLTLTDLNSRNGTYVRLKGERELSHGDYLFIGKKLLRVEITAA